LQAQEQELKYILGDEKGITRELTRQDIQHRPVLVIKGASKCNYVLSEHMVCLYCYIEIWTTRGFLKQQVNHRNRLCETTPKQGTLIKIFVDDCSETTISIFCPLITQHLEISHSEKLVIDVAYPLQTVQIDLCDDIKIKYRQNVMNEATKVYHAGVKNLVVERVFEGDQAVHDYTIIEDSEGAPKEEVQFVTHLKGGSSLSTERVRRVHG